jgi:hypothetical protein
VFERSGLCFLGMFAKGNREERERKDSQIESFSFSLKQLRFSFEETEERASC